MQCEIMRRIRADKQTNNLQPAFMNQIENADPSGSEADGVPKAKTGDLEDFF